MNRFKIAAMLLFSATALSAATGSFTKTVQPFIARNCVGCHNAKVVSGGLDLETRKPEDFTTKDRDLWERVVAKVKNDEMPPKPLPRLKPAESNAFSSFVESEYARLDRKTKPDPGRVTPAG